MMRRVPLRKYELFKDLKIRELVEKKLFALYVADHPELVSEEDVDKAVQKAMKDAKIKTLKEM